MGKSAVEKEKNTENVAQNSHLKLVSVPDWIKPIHDELIKIINPGHPDLFGRRGASIPVRILYSLLEDNGLFKDSMEKIMSL